MKQIHLILILSIALFAVGFQSCKNDSPLSMGSGLSNEAALEYISEDANMVASINMNALMQKMDFEAVKQMDFYKEMLQNAKAETPQLVYLLDNPAESGIDLNKDIYVSFDISGDVNEMVAQFVMAIEDKAKFMTMIQKANENGSIDVQKQKNYTIITANGETVIALNDEVAIAASGNLDIDALTTLVSNKITKKATTNIKKNKTFTKNFSGGHDMAIYQNTGAGLGMYETQIEPFLKGLNITMDDLKENYTFSTIDFNQGQVVADQKTILNKNVEELLKAIIKQKVNTPFNNFIPKDNLAGAMKAGLNMDGIYQLVVEQFGVAGTGMVDQQLMAFGLTFEDAMKAFDGDLFVAGYVYDGSDQPALLSGLKIGNKDNFNKMLEAGKATGMMRDAGDDTYSIMIPSVGMYQATIKDGVFLFGEADIMATINEGGFQKISKSDLDNKTYSMYGDLAAIQNAIPDLQLEETGIFRASGDLKGGKSVIETSNDQENSLKVLMSIINSLYKAMPKDERFDLYDNDFEDYDFENDDVEEIIEM